MSKNNDVVQRRRELVARVKSDVGADVYMLKISDASARVLMALIGSATFDERSTIPKYLGDRQWQDVLVTSRLSQSSISLLIHKDVRSIRNAIRALEGSGYISRLPHKPGEPHVTRIHVYKIIHDSADAYQMYQWSL